MIIKYIDVFVQVLYRKCVNILLFGLEIWLKHVSQTHLLKSCLIYTYLPTYHHLILTPLSKSYSRYTCLSTCHCIKYSFVEMLSRTIPCVYTSAVDAPRTTLQHTATHCISVHCISPYYCPDYKVQAFKVQTLSFICYGRGPFWGPQP